MKLKKLLFALLAICCFSSIPITIWAAKDQVKPLKKVRRYFKDRVEPGDSAKVIQMSRKGMKLARKDKVGALARVDSALSLAKELDHDYGIAFSYFASGAIHFMNGHYEICISFCEKAIPIFKRTNAPGIRSKCYSVIGSCHRILGNTDKAIAYTNKQLETIEAIPITEDAVSNWMRLNGIVASNHFLWRIYYAQGKVAAGYPHLQRIAEIRKQQGIVDPNLLSNIGSAYKHFGYLDSALYYYESGYQNAIRNDHRGLLAVNLGATLVGLERYNEAIPYFQLVIDSFNYKADAFQGLGNIYSAKGENDKALEHFLQALELRRKFHATYYIAETLILIGKFYISMEMYDQAKLHLTEAITVAEKISSTTHLAGAYLQLGVVYSKEQNIETALGYFDQCKSYNLIEENDAARAELNFQLGEAYKQLPASNEFLDSIQRYYHMALEQFKRNSMIVKTAMCLFGMGELYYHRKDYATAIEFLSASIQHAEQLHAKDILMNAHGLISFAYQVTGDDETALLHARKAYEYKDSIRNVIALREFNEIQEKYESEQKDTWIVGLEENNKRQKQFNEILIIAGTSVLLSIVLIGLLLIQRMRNRAKLKQQQVLYEERSRISSDLHDDISSTLSSVSMLSSFATDKIKEKDIAKATYLLEEISASSLQMGDELNDLIWTLNPRRDTMEELIERLQNYASPMASSKNIQLNFDIDPHIRKKTIPLEVRKNLFLILKEAIHNAIKYSNCQSLLVSLKENSGRTVILVKDDGIGFDPAKLNGEGNGLYNMRERAESIGANLKIKSEMNTGTVVEIVSGNRQPA